MTKTETEQSKKIKHGPQNGALVAAGGKNVHVRGYLLTAEAPAAPAAPAATEADARRAVLLAGSL